MECDTAISEIWYIDYNKNYASIQGAL